MLCTLEELLIPNPVVKSQRYSFVFIPFISKKSKHCKKNNKTSNNTSEAQAEHTTQNQQRVKFECNKVKSWQLAPSKSKIVIA